MSSPSVALRIGRKLVMEDHPRAAEVLQNIIDSFPSDEAALTARILTGLLHIYRGDDMQAESIYHDILSKYAQDPRLPQAISLMAEGYLDQAIAIEQDTAKRIGSANYAKMVREQGRSEVVKKYCRRAIEKWQIIIQDLPPTAHNTVQAWYFTGVVYRRHLGEPEKALPYYQKVADEWPDYQYAWSAQSMIGLCYENMIEKGKISREAAAPHIEQAYKTAIEKYPNSPLDAQTILKLARLSFDSGQWEQAISYYGQFLEKYPNSRQWANALLSMGTAFEKNGQPLLAADLYRSYLGITGLDDRHKRTIRARIKRLTEVEK